MLTIDGFLKSIFLIPILQSIKKLNYEVAAISINFELILDTTWYQEARNKKMFASEKPEPMDLCEQTAPFCVGHHLFQKPQQLPQQPPPQSIVLLRGVRNGPVNQQVPTVSDKLTQCRVVRDGGEPSECTFGNKCRFNHTKTCRYMKKGCTDLGCTWGHFKQDGQNNACYARTDGLHCGRFNCSLDHVAKV